jgi:hypothetical protein
MIAYAPEGRKHLMQSSARAKTKEPL